MMAMMMMMMMVMMIMIVHSADAIGVIYPISQLVLNHDYDCRRDN